MPAGRPTLYSEEYNEKAYKLCLLGSTDAEMADFFEVSESTLNLWKQAHPAFSESITRGKVCADANVAERMYERARGYSHEAVKIFMPAGSSEPVYAPYTEHYPPDTAAASLWLRNRQSSKWRDKQEHEHTGKDGDPLIPAEVDNTKTALALLNLLTGLKAARGEAAAAETAPRASE